MRSAGARAAVVVGGTIPETDAQLLKAMGIADVLPVGSGLDEVVARIEMIASEPAGMS
jgi:methylmalonyl-CoA mutase cobalamin-binding domain/chain